MSSQPDCRLILVPTAMELHHARELSDLATEDVVVELCGLGVIAAAARTSWLVARYRPVQVLLLGVAGAMDTDIEIGSACQFGEVACYGVGVGTGADYQSAADLGWRHWPSGSGIGDSIELLTAPGMNSDRGGQLLTVCAASNSEHDRRLRRQKFPQALAEDMEGFAVALACHLTDTPLRIVRGISNVAGVRDKGTWRIAEAMDAATRLARRVFEV